MQLKNGLGDAVGGCELAHHPHAAFMRAKRCQSESLDGWKNL